MKPTLIVLAAGMGSRYGSLKQMDGVGPSGEAILDYSVYDAIRGGFGRVVFVIRASFADDFRDIFNAERYGNKIEVFYVTQELDKLPKRFHPPKDRERPWGTNHAIMVAREFVPGNFAVVNADDFYGEDAIAKMGEYLQKEANTQGKYAMVGYQIKKTLSDNGTVSRGVCQVSPEGYLTGMVERTKIERQGDEIIFWDEQTKHKLPEDTLVSMNLFGFTSDYFRYSEELFVEFLSDERNMLNLRSEYFIPMVVNRLIQNAQCQMKVLQTTSDWFGVTYIEDKPVTEAKIRELVSEGVYPESIKQRIPDTLGKADHL